MDEQTARQKWCPMAANRGLNVTTHNSERVVIKTAYWAEGDDDDLTTNCIASDCMLWRWRRHTSGEVSNKHGYCGLGGRP